jgi:hypothetical protein
LLFGWGLFGINNGNMTKGLWEFVDMVLGKIIWVKRQGDFETFLGLI